MDQGLERAGKRFDIAGRNQQSAPIVFDHLWDPAHAGRDARAAETHGLEDAQTKALRFRGEQPDVRDLKVVLDVVDLLADDDSVSQAKPPDVLGERRERFPRENEELEGLARANAGDRLQQEIDALPRAKIGGMDDDDFLPEAEFAAHFAARAARRARGEEIVDDLDRAVEVEHPLGLPLQRLGHRRDRVRTGQSVPDGRGVTRVIAQQRRVRAVQRRDQARLSFPREHRSGENCGRRVRHRVVHMKHVQPMVAAHFGHAHRERQGIVGESEQLIVVDHDGMEMKPWPIRRQTKRSLVTDEMHLVSPARQVLPQRRRQHATPSNGGIAGDADP